jgi:DNA polymerase I
MPDPAPDTPRLLTGLHADSHGHIHLAWRDGGKDQTGRVTFNPFLWSSEPDSASLRSEALAGEGTLGHLLFYANSAAQADAVKRLKAQNALTEVVRPLEQQYLLATGSRCFTGLTFDQLRRCQLDIETAGEPGSGRSDPTRADDRVLAIGLRMGTQEALLTLEADTDAGEKKLLQTFNETLLAWDPDIIEGHNIFRFDLHFLKERGSRLKVPCAWGRFGLNATFRNSRIRVAERWIDFLRCDIPGRTVADTWLLVQIYDITRRELTGYGLKSVARELGLIDYGDDEERTYLDGVEAIGRAFNDDRERFLSYLRDDLRETAALGDLLLPTYLAQAQLFPMLPQDILLRGTASKVDLLFIEKYFQARHKLPLPSEVNRFEGGYTRGFTTGVYRKVLHFDVASLYPSLLGTIGRNPANDKLGVFMPMLRELKTYRLTYKRKAREASDETLRREYDARQAAFKILINSFYGYLGFGGARFADGELAAEVTARGRQLLQDLIAACEAAGCVILEADTDGIYLASDAWYDQPETLLEKVGAGLPDGIDLEWDGRYPAMLCYKAKNYALYDGQRVVVRGSALRSRGMEPFLRELTDTLIAWLLGASENDPVKLAKTLREALLARTYPVRRVAKREFLSQNPDSYQTVIAQGGKPRRAALEAALRSPKKYRMGDGLTYYITPAERKSTPDWQRAFPIECFDAVTHPYDGAYYADKIDDWMKRYEDFLAPNTRRPIQSDLFS